MDFEQWLATCTKKDGTNLSQRSIEHYASGLRIVSLDMYKKGIIDKRLEDMDIYELDIAIALILRQPDFVLKNKVGNNMYSNAIKRFRCYRNLNETNTNIIKAEKDIINSVDLTETEKEVIVKARIGQGLYRKNLLNKYGSKCIMTNISIPQVLVASHIKPWIVSNNSERIDVNNGLLLSASYDRLFDSGLITFDNEGRIIISSLINEKNRNILNIQNGQKYNILPNNSMQEYLSYHNNSIFVR